MSFTQDKETDNYTSPIKIWKDIINYIPKDKKIWSPFFCDGKQQEIFKELGFDIIHNDEDFFKNDRGEIIIDNIPFSKCKQVCLRLKELEKPFIIILPNHTLMYKRFQRPFSAHLQIIIPDKRMKFKNFSSDELSNLPFDCYYFCYKMNLPTDLVWLD